MANKVTKIAIGIPTYGTIKTKTVHSVFKLIKNLPYEWYFLTQTGSYIQDNRESIVKMARQLNCSHLLFVDHDMVFEPEVIEKLISRDKEIIGVDFNFKKLPFESVTKDSDPDGTKIWNVQSDGLVECCAVGTGLMLLDLSIFDKIPHPWFFVEPDGQGSVRYGEDMWFCKKARDSGFKIWLDPTVKVGHLGEYEY